MVEKEGMVAEDGGNKRPREEKEKGTFDIGFLGDWKRARRAATSRS